MYIILHQTKSNTEVYLNPTTVVWVLAHPNGGSIVNTAGGHLEVTERPLEVVHAIEEQDPPTRDWRSEDPR